MKEEKAHTQAIPSPKKKQDVKNKDDSPMPQKVKQAVEHTVILDKPIGNNKRLNIDKQ